MDDEEVDDEEAQAAKRHENIVNKTLEKESFHKP